MARQPPLRDLSNDELRARVRAQYEALRDEEAAVIPRGDDGRRTDKVLADEALYRARGAAAAVDAGSLAVTWPGRAAVEAALRLEGEWPEMRLAPYIRAVLTLRQLDMRGRFSRTDLLQLHRHATGQRSIIRQMQAAIAPGPPRLALASEGGE